MRKLIMYSAILVVVVTALLWFSSVYIGKTGTKTITANNTPSTTQAAPSATANSTSDTPQKQTNKIDVSFIINAEGAMLQRRNQQGYFSLFLNGVQPYISMITERPYREQKLVPLQEFIRLWGYGEDSLASNPPNAYLMSIYINGQINKGGKVYVLTLSDPTYDTKRNTLSFSVKMLQAPNYLLKQVKFDNITLTIER